MSTGRAVAEVPRSGWLEQMPAGWSEVHLRWLAKLYAGGTPDKSNEAFWTDGTIPWINSGAVNQGLITEASAYISQAGYDGSSARWVPKGALVMALAGQGKTKGTVAEMGIDATCNQSMAAIVPNGVNARYLFYWLTANYRRIRSGASDDLRDGLNLQMLGDIPCPVPSQRSDQERIANFLDQQTARIDALIAEKERLISAVDEFRSTTISEAVLVRDEPGWRQTRLKFLARDIIDTEHKTVPFYDDGAFLVARTTNIKGGRLTLEGAKYTDLAGYEEWTRRAVPSPGDILFTREAPAGEACLVPEGVPLCLGQRTVLIRLKAAHADPSFVCWSLYGGLASRFIADLSQGSTVAHFNMPDIGNIPLFTGPVEEQQKRARALETKLEQIDSLRSHVIDHIARLREYRSSLISAAVTGQLDLSTFKKAVQ